MLRAADSGEAHDLSTDAGRIATCMGVCNPQTKASAAYLLLPKGTGTQYILRTHFSGKPLFGFKYFLCHPAQEHTNTKQPENTKP